LSGLLADTHAVYWYLLDSDKLSSGAQQALDRATSEGQPIYVSAMTIVELQYLIEKGRLPEAALERLDAALDNPNSALVMAPLDRAVARAMASIARDAVPDMPDRVIAATALYLGVPLVTKDGRIRMASVSTIW